MIVKSLSLRGALVKTVTAQNFVDEVPASIAGNVSRDDDNNGTGVIASLADITVTLDDGAGNVLTDHY